MREASQDRWTGLCERLDCAILSDRFSRLAAAYSEKHRRYHTLTHIGECLDHLDRVKDLTSRPDELEFALWLHDVVYSTGRSDNEARSAAMAEEWLEQGGAEAARIERVRDLILATGHTTEPIGDAALMQDIDLNILGAVPARYDEYEDQIRQEYRWVPRVLFRRRRAQLLRGLLARDSIYKTEQFQERLEAAARTNLERSLRRLGGAGAG